VVVGRIGRPHGLRGHVKVHATGATLKALTPPIPVLLRSAEGDRAAQLIELSGVDDRLVALTSEASDREHAAGLTGGELLLPREALPKLADPDQFYVADLVGLDVEVDGRRAGRLVDVLERPANDVLEVEASDGRTLLVPFVEQAIVAVEATRGVIVLQPWAIGEPG
jgi:16S rRNA processing protein RimM